MQHFVLGVPDAGQEIGLHRLSSFDQHFVPVVVDAAHEREQHSLSYAALHFVTQSLALPVYLSVILILIGVLNGG